MTPAATSAPTPMVIPETIVAFFWISTNAPMREPSPTVQP
jgi:hypothetical protein